jgi:hypothetical protein
VLSSSELKMHAELIQVINELFRTRRVALAILYLWQAAGDAAAECINLPADVRQCSVPDAGVS